MPSAFYAFLRLFQEIADQALSGFSNFNKKRALVTLEQSSLAVYALFLTMALFKRKSNSTRLTGKLTKELIMKKQKLRPGLSGLSLPLQQAAYNAAFEATRSVAFLFRAEDVAVAIKEQINAKNTTRQ
jgi:hypothetical protein